MFLQSEPKVTSQTLNHTLHRFVMDLSKLYAVNI